MSENYLEASEVFAMQEYYERTHDIKCLMCGKRITATQDELERGGWLLNRHGEFCPKDTQYGNNENLEPRSIAPVPNVLRNRTDIGQRGVVFS